MSELKRVIIPIICAATIGVFAWLAIERETAAPLRLGENAAERYIEIVADGPILHYRETLSWDKNQFLPAQIEKFNERYDVVADNFGVEFNEENNATVFKCDVHGKEYAKNKYDLLWFLNVHGLDLIYDFTESERELSWRGTIDNVDTTVVLSFPFPIAHCHGHVWPK